MAERIIAIIAGPSGSGKSFFVANLHKALIYDTDIGGGLAYADARIRANGSERIMAGSYLDVLDDLKNRARSRRLGDFVNVAIDHISGLHQESGLRHNPGFAQDYGRSNEKATREWRQIREFVRDQDFNLICTGHLKAKFENDKAVGMEVDGAKRVEADASIVLYLRPNGDKYPATAERIKWRRDPDDPRGKVPARFPFTVADFAKIVGDNALIAPRQPIQAPVDPNPFDGNGQADESFLPESEAKQVYDLMKEVRLSPCARGMLSELWHCSTVRTIPAGNFSSACQDIRKLADNQYFMLAVEALSRQPFDADDFEQYVSDSAASIGEVGVGILKHYFRNPTQETA